MKEAAGTLLYQLTPVGVKVLIVHPSGNYNRHKPWSIPKGLLEPDEDAETAARRETFEETGVVADELAELGTVQYTKSKKRIQCFTGLAPASAEPRCASWEIDQAQFLSLEEARRLIHPEQAPLLDRLAEWLELRGLRVGVDVGPGKL